MSKGLQLTLVTVAVVLMGMSAMAEAPVIGEIPSPIVGGGEYTTPPNTFVYPDAINLNSFVSDDGGVENIVWSYETVGTQIYSINGTDQIDSLTEGDAEKIDPASVDKDLNTVRNGEINDDGNALNKITVRNVNLSPLGGENVDPGDTVGILSSETQVVTLYASDGSTYSQTEIMVYTDNEGQDRISGRDYETVYEVEFTNDAHGYNSTYGKAGTATMTVGGNGICIEVTALGGNIGQWLSPYAPFQMAANSVYRIRATMNGSQTDLRYVPLWDIIVQNFEGVNGLQGAYAYLTDYYFLSNQGGAYSVGPTVGIDGVELFFVPMPAKCPAWQDASTGAFTTANDPRNDIQIILRVLDADMVPGYGGEQDLGQICMQSMIIDRFDLDANVTEGATVVDTAIGQPAYRGYDANDPDTTEFDWSVADQVTIGPADGNFELEISQLEPGDGDIYEVDGEYEDDFPIVWEADTIYMIEVDVSAPTAGDEDQPVDVIQVGMDSAAWENFMVNSVTRGDSTMHNIGMPKNGTPQTYVSFFKSDVVSLSSNPGEQRLRARVQVLNSTDLSYGNAAGESQTQNTGDFTIHGITVKKVTIQ